MKGSLDRRDVVRWLGAGAAVVVAAGCSNSSPGRTAARTTARGRPPAGHGPEPAGGAGPSSASAGAQRPTPDQANAEAVATRFAGDVPAQWGTDVTGVATRISTSAPMVALTFDACGGPHGSGVDTVLLELLRREHLPATLFLNSRWIAANPEVTESLIADPLFEIANHGTHHRPLSVTGRSAYGIAGCRSTSDVVEEVEANHQRLTSLVGQPPMWFRSGTAYYDEVGAAIVTALGETPVSFAVNGDAGATFDVAQIHRTLAAPAPGSIVLMHMNQPRHATAAGLAAALPGLRAHGTQFVTLSGAGAPVVHA